MAVSEEIKHTLGRPLGRIPSGLFIVSASHEGKSSAMLGSWVQQAAFDPPAISIAIGKDREVLDLIRSSGRVAVSILGENDSALMKRYARGIKAGEDAFAGVNTLTTPGGIPVLADALGYLEGEVIQTVDFGADHVLLIARVTAGQLLKDAMPFQHTRGNGFHY
jgi:flavin reductase (DIM6/NTAB) family NADH-FMN oxidoreductase RutF